MSNKRLQILIYCATTIVHMVQTTKSDKAFRHYMMALADNVKKVMEYESKLEEYLSRHAINRTIIHMSQDNKMSIFDSSLELITLDDGSFIVYRRHTFDRSNSGYGGPTRNMHLYISSTEKNIRDKKNNFEAYLNRSIYTEQMDKSPFADSAKEID